MDEYVHSGILCPFWIEMFLLCFGFALGEVMFFRTLFLVCVAGSFGCSDHHVSGYEHDMSAPGAAIEVVPPLLDFGSLPNDESTVMTVTITNVGKNELEIQQLEMRGMDSFTMLEDELAFRLPPGAFKDVEIAFSPSVPEGNDGTLVVFSNDPSNWAVEVPLVGDGAIPELEINPDPHDFGFEYIGCDIEQKVELRNVGGDELIIDDVQYDGDSALWLGKKSFKLPIRLMPGEKAEVAVGFEPDAPNTYKGKLKVHSNDPRGWVNSTQLGDGVYFDEVEDAFTVPEAPPVDILFAVDQSCSMDDDNARLASNFSSFISKIKTVTTGWRIGVVTKNDGCFKYGYLDETTPSYSAKFNSAVLANDGGWYTERLLTLSEEALEQTASGKCNSGFLRAGAKLHVIMVSDEPEQSSTTWSNLVTQIQNYKSDPNDVKLSAVAGDYPSGCSTADPGAGYYQAVSATGGEFLSICDTNWAKHVDKLAMASIEGLNEFELSDADPDPSSITVLVDGVPWTTGWHYDASKNAVVIDDEVEENSDIVVNYGIIHTCK